MGYGNRKYNRAAYLMDGGANDEGWHSKYCYSCAAVTEHGRGEGCVPCGDKYIFRNSVKSITVAGSTGEHTVRLYPNGKRYCSCKSFKYRKTCGHLSKINFS